MTFDRKVKIAPSILAADFANFGAEVRAVEAQGADWIHVDVMDGHFVPALSFGTDTVKALRPHVKGVMDVHLMISPVSEQVDAYVAAGADVVTVHLEADIHIERTLQKIRKAGAKAGLALNPGTGLDALPYLLHTVDMVLVMSVNPGFGGQAFIPEVLPKIRAVREMIGEREIHIQVDGGVGPQNIAAARAAGVDVFVAGSSVFKGGSVDNSAPYGEAIRALRAAAGE